MCGGWVGKVTGLDWVYENVWDDFLGIVPGRGGIIGDFLEDTNDYLFHGGLEDDVRQLGRWIDDEIINPVYEFQKGLVNGLLDDPGKLIFDIVMTIATGGAYLAYKPYVDAAYAKANGASWEDSLKVGVTSYVSTNYAPKIGGNIGDKAANFAQSLGADAGMQEAINQMITEGVTQGTVEFATGGNFAEGFAQGVLVSGAQQGISKTMGYIEEKGGFSFEETQYDADGKAIVESKTYNSDTDTFDITYKTDLKTIPQVAQDLLAVSIAAELQGKEITPELLASTATKSLITSKVLNKALNKLPGDINWDSDMGRSYASMLLPAVQRSVANVLVNGVNEQAGLATANYILEAMDEQSQAQLFGDMVEFLDSIDTVGAAGNALKTAVDKVTGKYGEAEDIRLEMRGKQNQANMLINDRNAKVADLQTRNEEYQNALNIFEAENPYYIQARDTWVNALEGPQYNASGELVGYAGIDSAFSEFASPAELYEYTLEQNPEFEGKPYSEIQRAELQLSEMVADLVYLNQVYVNDIDEIDNQLKILEDDARVLSEELIPVEALLFNPDGLLGDMTDKLAPLVDITNKAMVESVAPDFDVDEYRFINNIPADVDAYVHYLNEGASTGAFTSEIQREAYTEQAMSLFKDNAMRVVGGQNASVQQLTDAQLARFNDIVGTYANENFMTDGKLDPDKMGTRTFFDAEGNVSTRENSVTVQFDFSQEFLDGLNSVGSEFDTVLNEDFNVSDAIAYLEGADSKAIELADGVDWIDVVSGGGIGYNAVTGRKEYVSKLTTDEGKDVTMWDVFSGNVNTFADGVSLEEIRQENPKTFWDTLVDIKDNYIAGVKADMDQQQTTIDERNQRAKESWAEFKEESKRFFGTTSYALLNTYEKIYDVAEQSTVENWTSAINNLYERTINYSDADFLIDIFKTQTTLGALQNQAYGEMGQALNGMLTVFGADPEYVENTALARWSNETIQLATSAKLSSWKANVKSMNELLSNRAVDDPNTPNINEAVWGTLEIIGGAFAKHPTEFLGEIIYKEGIQELVPLTIGGGVGVVTKLTMKNMGKEAATAWSTRAGLTAAGITDIAESAGGSAQSAYEESFNIIKGSLTERRDAGYINYTNDQIDQITTQYAADIAQRNGQFAGMTTALLLGMGGLALEKAMFGSNIGKRSEAFEAYANKLNGKYSEWLASTGKVAGKEAISEFLEEGAIENNFSSQILKWQPDRNVTGEVLFNATMGAIVAGPVSGTIAGVSSLPFDMPSYEDLTGRAEMANTGDVMANLLLTFSPDMKLAVGNMNLVEDGERKLYESFEELGISYDTASELIDAANDSFYTSTVVNFPTGEDSDFGALPPPDFSTFETRSARDLGTAKSVYYDPTSRQSYQQIGSGADATWVALGNRDIDLFDGNINLAIGDTFRDKISNVNWKVVQNPKQVITGYTATGPVTRTDYVTSVAQQIEDPMNLGVIGSIEDLIARDSEIIDNLEDYVYFYNKSQGQHNLTSYLQYPPGSGNELSFDAFKEKAREHYTSRAELQRQKITPERESLTIDVSSVANPDVSINTETLMTNLYGDLLFDGDGYVKNILWNDVRTSVPGEFEWDENSVRHFVNYVGDAGLQQTTSAETFNADTIKSLPFFRVGGMSQNDEFTGNFGFVDPRDGSRYLIQSQGSGIQQGEQYRHMLRVVKVIGGDENTFQGDRLDFKGEIFLGLTDDASPSTALEELNNNPTKIKNMFINALSNIADARGESFDIPDASIVKPDDAFNIDQFVRAELTRAGLSRRQTSDYIYSKSTDEHINDLNTDGIQVFDDLKNKTISLEEARQKFKNLDSDYVPTEADLMSGSTQNFSYQDLIDKSINDIQNEIDGNVLQIVRPDDPNSKMTMEEFKEYVMSESGWTQEQADTYVSLHKEQLQANLNTAGTQSQFKTNFGQALQDFVITEAEARAAYAQLYPQYSPTAQDISNVITGTDVGEGQQAGLIPFLQSEAISNKVASETARIAEEIGNRDGSQGESEVNQAILDAVNGYITYTFKMSRGPFNVTSATESYLSTEKGMQAQAALYGDLQRQYTENPDKFIKNVYLGPNPNYDPSIPTDSITNPESLFGDRLVFYPTYSSFSDEVRDSVNISADIDRYKKAAAITNRLLLNEINVPNEYKKYDQNIVTDYNWVINNFGDIVDNMQFANSYDADQAIAQYDTQQKGKLSAILSDPAYGEVVDELYRIGGTETEAQTIATIATEFENKYGYKPNYFDLFALSASDINKGTIEGNDFSRAANYIVRTYQGVENISDINVNRYIPASNKFQQNRFYLRDELGYVPNDEQVRNFISTVDSGEQTREEYVNARQLTEDEVKDFITMFYAEGSDEYNRYIQDYLGDTGVATGTSATFAEDTFARLKSDLNDEIEQREAEAAAASQRDYENYIEGLFTALDYTPTEEEIQQFSTVLNPDDITTYVAERQQPETPPEVPETPPEVPEVPEVPETPPEVPPEVPPETDDVGRRADIVTQEDITATEDILARVLGEFLPTQTPTFQESDLVYDVNNDGSVDQTDLDLLNQLYAGQDATYNRAVEGLPEDSRFASTGIFATLDDEMRARADIQSQLDAQQEINQNLNTITKLNTAIQLADLIAEEQALGGSQRIDVTSPEKKDLEYLYDFESIFATPEEESLYTDVFGDAAQFGTRKKAAATGGLINDTDRLIKLLGK
tara:strand:+ start:1514 stop:9586 length:8073 start_codon:yes stop_codon:yes gene_type:complete